MSDETVTCAALSMLLAVLTCALLWLTFSCTPLPPPHPERWESQYGATDYPQFARDAGKE